MGQKGWIQARLTLGPGSASRDLLAGWEWGRGLALGRRCGGRVSPCPPSYEFCGGMAYCGPQAEVGLVPQGGLRNPQPEVEAGAGVASNSEGASPKPCAAPPLSLIHI